MLDYAPNKQSWLCRDKELCYFGKSPTLAELNSKYNKVAAQMWLIPQIDDVSEFSNCKKILSAEQIRSCADMIAAEYYYLKITELMLFFYKLKAGEYGQFYGSVSPMVIMCSLRQFMKERNDVIFQHESKEREKERQEIKEVLISAKEHYKEKVQAITWYIFAISYVIRLFLGFTDKRYNNDKD